MTAKLIDGKYLAGKIKENLKQQIAALTERKPGLAVILMGEDPASHIYVKNKQKACQEVGIYSIIYNFPANIEEEVVLNKIRELNIDPLIDGILVQLPLPASFNQFNILNTLAPSKDIDGFHVTNVGKLTLGLDGFIPCTAIGCLELINSVLPDLRGIKALVIGRSNIVGRPTAQLLLRAGCTVTQAHSTTVDLAAECLAHQLIIVAIGKPLFIQASWLRADAIIIDVGINRVEINGKYRLVGDVDFDKAVKQVAAITPVPGGVGPMTIACLLQNTFQAFRQNNLRR